MRESELEALLVKEVEARGGIAYKFSSPNRRNVPDRLCVFPRGRIVFVEVKATYKKPKEAQWREIHRLEKLGFTATWFNSEKMLANICTSLFPPL